MPQLIWINGRVMPLAEAKIGVEDRGFQFADGVYEVVRIYDSKLFALDEHLERLARSSAGILLTMPMAAAKLAGEIAALTARSGVAEGMLYLQLTRGVSPRGHVFAPEPHQHTLLFYVMPLDPPAAAPPGVKLHRVEDDRWQRCCIKSIALLPNVLAKNAAAAVGADEAVFVDHGVVTECAASNFFAVIGGKLVTHPVGAKVLPGITRQILLELCPSLGIPVSERPLRESEALAAEEMFIASTTREINWVSHWDGRVVGGGSCGAVTRRLHQALRERVTG